MRCFFVFSQKVLGVSCCSRGPIHSGEHDRPCIRIPNNQESSPRGVLRLPENRKVVVRQFPFPCIRIFHAESQSSPRGTISCGKNPTLIVASIVAMQYDSSAVVTKYQHDAVLEDYRQT